MKNKHKLIIGIIILIIAFSAFLLKDEIAKFSTDDDSEFEPVNLDEIPETDNTILTSKVQAVEVTPGSKEYALLQKYRVGKNEYCVRDCLAHCSTDGLEYYKAYVQSYGSCMCKCIAS
jgi:hypothetical protein